MIYIILALVAILIIITNKYLDLQTEIKDLKRFHEEDKKKNLNISRNSLRGQLTEELAPLFGEFPYELSDCKFMGSPIDYIVFDGMSKLRDTGEGEINIIISDVKTNSASLSKVQKGIKDAIDNCRFKFEKWNIKNNSLTIK